MCTDYDVYRRIFLRNSLKNGQCIFSLKITREGFVIEFGTENAEECEEAITQPLIDSACNDIQFYLRFCTSVYITNRNAPVLQLGITKIFYSNMNFQPISPSMPLFPEILKSPDAII